MALKPGLNVMSFAFCINKGGHLRSFMHFLSGQRFPKTKHKIRRPVLVCGSLNLSFKPAQDRIENGKLGNIYSTNSFGIEYY